VITDQQRSFIRLIMRSPDIGDEFRTVSTILTPLVTRIVAELPELYELRTTDEGCSIRLTTQGLTVAKYL